MKQEILTVRLEAYDFSRGRFTNDAILKDFERIDKIINYDNFEKAEFIRIAELSKLCKIFLEMKVIANYKHNENTAYKQEVKILEAFIKYLIATFLTYYDFDRFIKNEAIKRDSQYVNTKKNTELEKELETVEIDTEIEDIEIELTSNEEQSVDLDFEDF